MDDLSLAEKASQSALDTLFRCIDNNQHFRLEAGAGAGKTFSLIKALEYLINIKQDIYHKKGKKIACITYTNVAKDEIIARIDRNPIIFCDTNHAFCWSLIGQFQKQLREIISESDKWKAIIAESKEDIKKQKIVYELGHRSIKDGVLSLHHDDVISIIIELLKIPKFRQMVIEKYPIILIDEYQDTDKNWIEAIKSNFLDGDNSPLFGFFGDHWQKIYGNGCGLIEHNKLMAIDKKANFRSNKLIVSVLNNIRQDLHQYVNNERNDGSIHIFHTNNWDSKRQTASHWQGDLSEENSLEAFHLVKAFLIEQGWDFDKGKTKILMLTHKLLANAQGYSQIAKIFKYNDSFIKKENKYIEFFVDKLEPACEAFINKKYGLMFNVLSQKSPLLLNHLDKVEWQNAMNKLIDIRKTGTIADVINLLKETYKPGLPDFILKKERELLNNNNCELSSSQQELISLHKIPYLEIIELKKFLDGYSPFQTQHGVKGAEFENVLVIVGRGWNHYNFGNMLKWIETGLPEGKGMQENLERNRNLFYVACSRPKKRLTILFTQQLEEEAITTLNKWFGKENIYVLSHQTTKVVIPDRIQ